MNFHSTPLVNCLFSFCVNLEKLDFFIILFFFGALFFLSSRKKIKICSPFLEKITLFFPLNSTCEIEGKLRGATILNWLVFLVCEQRPNHYELLIVMGVETCGWVSWCFVYWNEVARDLCARPLPRLTCKAVLHLEPHPSTMSLALIPDLVHFDAHRAKYLMFPRKFAPLETQPEEKGKELVKLRNFSRRNFRFSQNYLRMFLISRIDDRMATNFSDFTPMTVKCPTANFTRANYIFYE